MVLWKEVFPDHTSGDTHFKTLLNVEGNLVGIKVMQLKPLSLGEGGWQMENKCSFKEIVAGNSVLLFHRRLF